MRKFLTIVAAILAFVACSKDGESALNKTSLNMYVGEEYQLSYSGNCTWTSDNPLIASVKNGLVTANFVGTTYIYANSSACKVNVLAKNKTYIDAYTDFGSYYTDARDYYIDNGATMVTADKDGGVFEGKRGEMYVYVCESLGSVSATALLTSLYSLEQCVEYLLERYVPITIEDDLYVFADPNGEFGVTLMLNTDLKAEYMVNVMYIPINSRATAINYSDIIREKFNL